MTSTPAGGVTPPSSTSPAAPCRRDGCKRVARPESPWCELDFLTILSSAYREPKWAKP